MTVVNLHTGEVFEGQIVHDLSAPEARALTDEIRQTLRVGHDLIIRAYQGRAWIALGYTAWDDYCAGEFAEARMVRLDREQRREIVAQMQAGGMSQAAIASGLNVSPSTIALDATAIRDNHPEIEELPDRIVGLDGKSRPSRAKPRPEAGTERSPELRRQRADLIADLASQGYSSRQMPGRVGVTEESIRKIARDFDIDIPADKIVGRSRRIDWTDVVATTVSGLEDTAEFIRDQIDLSQVDYTEADEWVASLTNSINELRKFTRKIKEATHVV